MPQFGEFRRYGNCVKQQWLQGSGFIMYQLRQGRVCVAYWGGCPQGSAAFGEAQRHRPELRAMLEEANVGSFRAGRHGVWWTLVQNERPVAYVWIFDEDGKRATVTSALVGLGFDREVLIEQARFELSEIEPERRAKLFEIARAAA